MRGLGGLARRSLGARRLRSALTILGIGLGVAVLTAALIVNAALDGAVDRNVRDAMGSAALRVTALTETGLSPTSRAQVASAAGVAVVAPILERRTYPIPGDEAPADALPAPVTVLGIDPAADAALHARPLSAGAWLAAAGDVVISATLARQDGLSVGGSIGLLGGDAGPVEFRVSGILTPGSPAADPLGRVMLVTLPAAGALFETEGVSRVEIGLVPGGSTEAAIGEIERALTTDPYTIATPSDLVASLRASTRDFRSSIALVAAIVLFGGAFLIFNTLAMTVRERARDLGLLRAAGLTRDQVVRLVLLIALQLGLVGVALGVAAGIVLAIVVLSYLEPGGIEAALRTMVIPLQGVALGALVGLGVTLAAALEPAFRAGRIPPIEALTARLDQTAVLRARIRWLVVVFAVVAGAGLVLWPGALSSPGGLLVPVAVYALLLVVALVSPLLVRPLGALAIALLRPLLPVETSLARGALVREPSRTGLTVGALAIAIAVFVALGGVASSTRQATAAWMADVLPGDLVLTAVHPVALDDAAALDLASTPGVSRFSPYARFSLASDGRRLDGAAVVGADLLADGRLSLVAGDRAAALTALDEGGAVILPQATAERLGIPLGGTLRVLAGRSVIPLRVVGIAARTIPGDAGPAVLVGWRDAGRHLGVAGADGFVVRFAADTPAPVRSRLEAQARAVAFEPVPLAALAGALGASIDRLSILFAGLALVALLVAALGIVNTLTMNVLERVREIAILRASGLTRPQAWRLVMLEAGVLGLVGSVLGVLAGLGAGAVLVALGGSVGGATAVVEGAGAAAGATVAGGLGGAALGGPAVFVPAWGSVVVALVGGVALALLAAAYPARIAGRVEIVRTIQHD